MNRHEITEIRRSWELAGTRMPLLTQLFQTRLQLIGKRHRPLFGDDAETNALLLLRLAGIVVNGLNQPRILYPLLETLGRQNARQIISGPQDCVVIRALLRALKATLGPAFNSTARHAWIAGCRTVVKAMNPVRENALFMPRASVDLAGATLQIQRLHAQSPSGPQSSGCVMVERTTSLAPSNRTSKRANLFHSSQ